MNNYSKFLKKTTYKKDPGVQGLYTLLLVFLE